MSGSSFKIQHDAMPQDMAAVEAEIRQYLNEWAVAVNSCNADAIAALYALDAVLLGTFEPKVLTTPEGRLDYFVNFKTRKNLHAFIDERHIKTFDQNAGMANGLYTFTFVDGNRKPQTAKARFTFVYERQPEGDWLIAAHHSSVAPG